MKRRDLIAVLASICASPLPGRAQRPAKMPRVGVLTSVSISEVRAGLLVQELARLGYIDGQNVHVEFRAAEGRPERLNELATELVASGVDVIVAAATPGTRAAQKATTTIPIVGYAMADPVRDGLVLHYSSPERNITGNTFLGPELVPKRLGLLKDLLPSLSRVGVLWHPDAYSKQTMTDMLGEVEQGAAKLNLFLVYAPVHGSADFEAAFANLANERVEAVLEFPSQMLFLERKRLVELAAFHRLPTMWNAREFVELGGLIAYGASIADLTRRAATYVDRLLRGAKPSELPVEQPTKFELLINTTTAKALGLEVPRSLLLIADEVIE